MGIRQSSGIVLKRRGPIHGASANAFVTPSTPREKLEHQLAAVPNPLVQLYPGYHGSSRKELVDNIASMLGDRLFDRMEWKRNNIVVTTPKNLKTNVERGDFSFTLHRKNHKKDGLVEGNVEFFRSYDAPTRTWSLSETIKDMELKEQAEGDYDQADVYKTLSKQDRQQFEDLLTRFSQPGAAPLEIAQDPNFSPRRGHNNMVNILGRYFFYNIFNDPGTAKGIRLVRDSTLPDGWPDFRILDSGECIGRFVCYRLHQKKETLFEAEIHAAPPVSGSRSWVITMSDIKRITEP